MSEYKYPWINESSLRFLSEKSGYLMEGETPESRFELIAETLQQELKEIPTYKEEFLEFLQDKFYALSTPFISNVGRKNFLPFSCSNQYVGDSMGEILFAKSESGMMTKMGMGCSTYMDMRKKGSPISNSTTPSPGSIHVGKGFQEVIREVNQGVRRGYIAMYWDINHGDILDVLEIKRDGSELQHVTYGVCIDDQFMIDARNGDEHKQKVLFKVHQSRFLTGLPYLFFTDNVNNARPDVYVDNNFKINSSNLCTEILEVSDEKYSFVCDLAAINAEKIDDPRFARATKILTWGLDALHNIFQRKIEEWRDSDSKEENLKFVFLEKAYLASKDFRDIGVGCTGWHSLLQNRMIPYESLEAKMLNARVFSTIQKYTLEASQELSKIYGEPKMLEGRGRRNCLMNAVAPNTSSAFILGQVSQGIEPYFSNYYVKSISKAKTAVKNQTLLKLLEEKDCNTKDVWDQIKANDGSVANLDCLTDKEKNVFKTFREIAPLEIIQQAAQRQKFIDQGQSTNLMIDERVGYKQINKLVYEAWELGVKTLYYQHGINAAQQLKKDILECESCAG